MSFQTFRVVMHFDFDYFFAQVEERKNPTIKDKPVVVCVYSGRGEDSGAVSTANYIAREYGVKSGIAIVLAKKRLRNVEAKFLPVNHMLYKQVSDSIIEIIRSYSDRFEQVGIDEAFLEVTDRVNRSFEEAKILGYKIKREIFSKEGITCSIGIGSNKLIAKIAAGMEKPDGLALVIPEDVRKFLNPLPIRKLPGIGKKIEKKVHKLGIKTIGELAAHDLNVLVNTFGKTLGTYFHNAAMGIDETPVQETGPTRSISRILTLKDNTRDLEKINQKILELAKDVHIIVISRNLSFQGVSVIAVMEDLTIRSRAKTFDRPKRNLEQIEKNAILLFEQILKKETEKNVRRVGLKIFNFSSKDGQKKLIDF